MQAQQVAGLDGEIGREGVHLAVGDELAARYRELAIGAVARSQHLQLQLAGGVAHRPAAHEPVARDDDRAPRQAGLEDRAVGRRAADTTTRAVRVNQGGNSVPITTVNTSDKGAQVSTGERAVDTLKVADIPPRNSERNAVRVNVGGGSKAVTDVNTSNSASTATDSTVTVPALVIDCTDSTRTRKP